MSRRRAGSARDDRRGAHERRDGRAHRAQGALPHRMRQVRRRMWRMRFAGSRQLRLPCRARRQRHQQVRLRRMRLPRPSPSRPSPYARAGAPFWSSPRSDGRPTRRRRRRLTRSQPVRFQMRTALRPRLIRPQTRAMRTRRRALHSPMPVQMARPLREIASPPHPPRVAASPSRSALRSAQPERRARVPPPLCASAEPAP